MDLAPLKASLAPPIAALFLLLALVAFAPRQKPSAGVPLRFYPPECQAKCQEPCNARRIVVSLDREGTIRINETTWALSDLRPKLSEIYENRYVKDIFVIADHGVAYQTLLDFFSQIDGASPGLEVILLSGETRRAVEDGEMFECVFIPPPLYQMRH